MYCWQILFADGTVSSCQVSEDILHSGHNTFSKDKDYLREQSMDGRDSKERKGMDITIVQSGKCNLFHSSCTPGMFWELFRKTAWFT